MGRCVICKTIFKGRADKKFCSVSCKNTFHLKLAKASENYTHKVDKILHRNHRILMVLMGKSLLQLKISRVDLVKKNFNFDFITGFYLNSQGKTYHYVYEFAWMEFSTQEIMVVRTARMEVSGDNLTPDAEPS